MLCTARRVHDMAVSMATLSVLNFICPSWAKMERLCAEQEHMKPTMQVGYSL